MRVVILAAGKGKRMGDPLPKVLQKIGDKTMIEMAVGAVIDSGVTDKPVTIIVGSGTEENIKECLGEKCNYVYQAKQLGTAHAVLCTKDFLDDCEDLLVLYGDQPFLTPETLSSLKEVHDKEGSVLTMMTVELPNFFGWHKIFKDFGRIVRDDEGMIKGIVEKKDATPEQLEIKEVNPSFFCFKTDWLWENISKIGCKNAQQEYYLTDLVELAISQNKKVRTLVIKNPKEAVGVNDKEQLQLANDLL